MKREELATLLCDAATAQGYVFHSGTIRRINGTVRVYPAAWLEPPVLKSAQGRTEGDVTYRITLHFMALPSAADVPEALSAGLGQDALAVARSLAENGAVSEVANISCTPAEQSLTVHGEVSVTLACDVTMWYYI